MQGQELPVLEQHNVITYYKSLNFAIQVTSKLQKNAQVNACSLFTTTTDNYYFFQTCGK